MIRVSLTVLAVVLLTACSVPSDSPLAPAAPLDARSSSSNAAFVTNGGDTGPGSFRQAIIDANNDASIQHVVFSSSAVTIALQQPIVFTGAQALAINGNGSIVDGGSLAPNASAFVANGGAHLELRDLTFRDAPGTGITVAVPATAAGTLRVSLVNIAAIDNGAHGVLINDQAEYFIDPNSTSPLGSNASLDVSVVRSRFERNGFVALDQDGLRLNEGGAGDLRVLISATHVEGNGGDGIEFDERGAGDVTFRTQGSVLEGNGGFDASDYDDGIDIDEAGDGSIVGSFLHTSANNNFEQGFDINENDAGDIRVDMTHVQALNNLEEGIEYEEDDDFAGGGDIVAELHNITTSGNGAADGDAGLKLREKGVGNLLARLFTVASSGNFTGGVLLREDAAGSLDGVITDASVAGNNGHGIEYDENSSGDFEGLVRASNSVNNAGAGVRADQATPGSGALRLISVAVGGNSGGSIVANSGVTVRQTP